MADPNQVPEYEVISNKGVFVPTKADGTSELLPFGSRLKTWMSPSQHVAPLNAAAEAAFEAWYNLEHPMGKPGEPQVDGSGKIVKWKPNMQHKLRTYTPGERSEVEVLSLPVRDAKPLMGLAEIMLAQVEANADQRPGPSHVRPEVRVDSTTEPAKTPDDDAPLAVATSIPPSTSTITKKV